MPNQVYEVRTNLPPDQVTAVGLKIFEMWLDFALGQLSIGGKKLMHPTGKYAANIRFQREGESRVAIIVDENAAPEAGILEAGHKPFDLKTKFQKGRSYPMHRGGGSPGFRPSMWAAARNAGATGFATVGDTGWILPAMPAYSTGKILAELAGKMASEGGIAS